MSTSNAADVMRRAERVSQGRGLESNVLRGIVLLPEFFPWRWRALCDTLRRMKWVLFYDGDCAFCTKSVNRVFDLDRKAAVDFSPLQGELARARDLGKHADPQEGTMVVLRESDGAIFLRSDALIELARVLGGGFGVLAMLARLVPRPILDGAYKWFARNRHRFGGGADACRLPTPEFLARVRA